MEPNGPKGPIFGQKANFCTKSHFSTFCSRVRATFVKKNGRRATKSSPSQLWGHRLPVTARALSARRLDSKSFWKIQTIKENSTWDFMFCSTRVSPLCIGSILGPETCKDQDVGQVGRLKLLVGKFRHLWLARLVAWNCYLVCFVICGWLGWSYEIVGWYASSFVVGCNHY